MNLARVAAAILHAIADELDPPIRESRNANPVTSEPAPPAAPPPPAHTWNADPPLITYAEPSPEVDADRPGFHL